MDVNVPDRLETISLHDAELERITMDRPGGRLQLGFKGVDGIDYDLFFDDILTYRINNVQYQNVVSRNLVSNSESGFADDLEAIARWTCSGAEDRLLVAEEALNTSIAKIRAGELVLFYLEPSWGAEAGVIAKTIRIVRKAHF